MVRFADTSSPEKPWTEWNRMLNKTLPDHVRLELREISYFGGKEPQTWVVLSLAVP